jgi:hypothetical protein
LYENFSSSASEAVGRSLPVTGQAGRAAKLTVSVTVHIEAIVTNTVIGRSLESICFAGAALSEVVTSSTRVSTGSTESVGKYREARVTDTLVVNEIDISTLAR